MGYVWNCLTSLIHNAFLLSFNKCYLFSFSEYLKNRGTQAFICCDKAEDANAIVLAFRGTEPFNAYDWITDVDLSWLSMGKFGKAHLGFMRALGLQDEKDVEKGFPREHAGHEEGKLLAYYAIREELNQLLEKHKRAKIIITGHSLGGALAILFPALLAMHERHDIIDRIHGVMTYGQPRVGDAVFGRNVQAVLKSKYHRMVYRYDIVPRVPFDKPPVALFKHFGTCIYFTSWYEGKVRMLALLPPFRLEHLQWNVIFYPSNRSLFLSLFDRGLIVRRQLGS
ncbi:lipase, partial [Dendrobium catenatum]|uniref:lipase n=1 Tax=Dendrobium catenatum TaxID=906689 RepID=UPI0010A0A81E